MRPRAPLIAARQVLAPRPGRRAGWSPSIPAPRKTAVPPDDPDDSLTALLRRARAGEQPAWDRLVERFSALLWSVARGHRLGQADAGDVVQTTWLRLLEHLGRIEDPERLPGWLATTARHECLRVLRNAGREQRTGDDDAPFDVPDAGDPPDARLLSDERDAQLWACFARLSARCQTLLRVLMADPPPSYADVSVALGMPVGSIGPTRGRCLGHLREMAATRGVAPSGLTEGASA